MSEPPFAMSAEAAACVESVLVDAQRMPETIFLATVLAAGPPTIQWRDREAVSNGSYVEIELVGFRVFIHEVDVTRLCGKRMELNKRGWLVFTEI